MLEQKPKIPCTVQVFTLNSGGVLRRCLESLKGFDDILILDGNSTDDTLAIAREYTNHIVKQADTDQPNYRIKDVAALRNKAIEEGRYDWNFYLDTDEELPARTAEEIRRIVTTSPPEYFIYQLPGHIHFNGREIVHSTAYPGYQMRLLNRAAGIRHERTPHSRPAFDARRVKVGTMENPWFVILEPGSGVKQYEPAINRGHIQIQIREAMKIPLSAFFYWIVLKNIASLGKTSMRMLWMYARYGLSGTLPPHIEVKRLQYKLLFLFGAIKFRIRLALLGEQSHEKSTTH
ncbi:MAG: glycosyltransferase [Patescibacteria group bacterium]